MFRLGTVTFLRRLNNLIRQPIFLALTLLGHGIILGGAFLFYYFEAGENLESYFDAVYWAISTVTTVGSADVTPGTVPGKAVAMIMMITGCWLFWAYTALFAGALIAPELKEMEKEVRHLESDLHRIVQKERPTK
jgi:hypothetical protein